MTNGEFKAVIEETYTACNKLIKEKGEDYTKGSLDILSYFKEASIESGIPPKKVLYVLMRKHWAAIGNYIKTDGKSQSEPIDGRIQDLINYLIFLRALNIENKL